jgi:hypothetical protein
VSFNGVPIGKILKRDVVRRANGREHFALQTTRRLKEREGERVKREGE